MRDYVKELSDFQKKFGTEEQCRNYLFALRWSEGFRCPNCEHDKYWELNEIKYKCRKCRTQISLYVGIFQRTHKPLTLWFLALWYISLGGTDKNEMQSLLNPKHIKNIGSRHTVIDWCGKLVKLAHNSKEYRTRGEITFRELLLNAIEYNP
jgi:hypothetical protein